MLRHFRCGRGAPVRLPPDGRLGKGARACSRFGATESDDESLKALNYILEAWEEGTDSGIAPELMAYAALYTALTDLVASFGEESVVSLVNGLAPRVEKGEFTLCRQSGSDARAPARLTRSAGA